MLMKNLHELDFFIFIFLQNVVLAVCEEKLRNINYLL